MWRAFPVLRVSIGADGEQFAAEIDVFPTDPEGFLFPRPRECQKSQIVGQLLAVFRDVQAVGADEFDFGFGDQTAGLLFHFLPRNILDRKHLEETGPVWPL